MSGAYDIILLLSRGIKYVKCKKYICRKGKGVWTCSGDNAIQNPTMFFLSNLSILYWIYLKDIQLTKYLWLIHLSSDIMGHRKETAADCWVLDQEMQIL